MLPSARHRTMRPRCAPALRNPQPAECCSRELLCFLRKSCHPCSASEPALGSREPSTCAGDNRLHWANLRATNRTIKGGNEGRAKLCRYQRGAVVLNFEKQCNDSLFLEQPLRLAAQATARAECRCHLPAARRAG